MRGVAKRDQQLVLGECGPQERPQGVHLAEKDTTASSKCVEISKIPGRIHISEGFGGRMRNSRVLQCNQGVGRCAALGHG